MNPSSEHDVNNSLYEAEIPEGSLPLLLEKITRYNRKAAKLGKAPIEVEQGETVMREYKIQGFEQGRFRKVAIPVVPVSLKGEIPRIKEGWKVVGKLDYEEDHTGHEPAINGAPGEELPRQLRRCECTRCDHCRKNIPRKALFVLKRDEKFMVVGGSCLKDFDTGVGQRDIDWLLQWHARIDAITQMCADLADPDSDLFSAGMRRSPPLIDLDEYLYYCAMEAFEHGIVTRTEAMETDKHATASIIYPLLAGQELPPDSARNLFREYGDPDKPPKGKERMAAEALQKVREIREWLGGLDPETSNDFLHNLLLIHKRGYVGQKSAGYATAMIPAHERSLSGRRERTVWPPSEHVADQSSEKERMKLPKSAIGRLHDFECVVLAQRWFDGKYGTQACYTLRQSDTGNILYCYTTRPPSIDDGDGERELDRGDVVRFDALIKRYHESQGGRYEGTKVTIIKSMKKVTWLGRDGESAPSAGAHAKEPASPAPPDEPLDRATKSRAPASGDDCGMF